jgi:hypothetical protein
MVVLPEPDSPTSPTHSRTPTAKETSPATTTVPSRPECSALRLRIVRTSEGALAGVTRGATYHQYPDTAKLFLAVLEVVESDVIERLSATVLAKQPKTSADALRISADAWVDIASEPEARQLVLLDAPRVPGWTAFREISLRTDLS